MVGLADDATPRAGAHFEIKRTWTPRDVLSLALDFSPTLWAADPLVADAGSSDGLQVLKGRTSISPTTSVRFS